MEERIQKIMSHAGLGSRRACEELILAGRVTVNGKVAEIGQKADSASDRIVVDGRVISASESPIYIALYKPRMVLSAVEAEPNDFRKTVRSLIPVEGHIYPVGRLDFDSEGLVLMTNDGDLANKLTHPRFGHLKIYRVLVARRPDDEQLATWRRGVVLEDGYKTAPADVSLEASAGKGAWLRVVMHEGRKRQIREIGSLLGMPVVRIVRIAIGALRLGTLKPGDWRHLTFQEVSELKSDSAPKVEAYPSRPRRPGSGGPGDTYRERPARSSGGPSKYKRRPDSGESGSHSERPARPSGGYRSGSGDSDSRSERPVRPAGGPSKYGRRPDSGDSDSRSERPVRPGGQMQRDRRSDSGDSGSRSERPARPAGGPSKYSRRPDSGNSDSRSERPSGGYRSDSGHTDSRSERPARPAGGPSKYGRRPDSGNSDSRSERPSGGYRSGSGDSDRPTRSNGGPSKYSRRPDSANSDSSRSERPSGGYRSGSGDSDSRSDRPARPAGGASKYKRRPDSGNSDSRSDRPSGGYRSGGDSDSRSDRPGGGQSQRTRRPSSGGTASRPERKSPEGSSRPSKPNSKNRSRK
ncbi:MAG: hypothetical protein CVU44_18090 [Chloroflexi bacterium HGW-Chloroflexi-6]|nr:MAG: hypothetical protein CVU44_18090 [Chloroflexi bacterium HGW-Chloroflexi-6]